jgi:hypothetical protein
LDICCSLHTSALHKAFVMVQYNAHSSGIIALIVIFGSLSILAVILRFVARSRTKAKYGADDWFAVASLISVLAYMGIMIWGVFDNP